MSRRSAAQKTRSALMRRFLRSIHFRRSTLTWNQQRRASTIRRAGSLRRANGFRRRLHRRFRRNSSLLRHQILQNRKPRILFRILFLHRQYNSQSGQRQLPQRTVSLPAAPQTLSRRPFSPPALTSILAMTIPHQLMFRSSTTAYLTRHRQLKHTAEMISAAGPSLRTAAVPAEMAETAARAMAAPAAITATRRAPQAKAAKRKSLNTSQRASSWYA